MNSKLIASDVRQKKHTNEELFYKQIEMLRGFLKCGAISQAQYDKSAGDLARLTGFSESGKNERQ